MRWSAQSTVSGLSFQGSNHLIELSHGHGAEQECIRILEIITSDIPSETIVDFTTLNENLLLKLRKLGYTKSSPLCELRIIEKSTQVCRYGVFPSSRVRRESYVSYQIEITGTEEPDVILDCLETGLAEGDLSNFNIENVDSFLDEISDWLTKNLQ